MEKTIDSNQKKTKNKAVSYAKWGYIFILPFFAIYLIFTLYPQITTIFYSFCNYYELGLDTYGPEFVGFKNYIDLFTANKNNQMVFNNNNQN